MVCRTIVRHLISQAGLTRTRAATGGVTLIQRFGLALNLNIHFYMLFLDGVYLFKGAHPPLFRPVAGPSARRFRPGCWGWNWIRTVRPARADSRCTPGWTSRPGSARSSSGYAVT